MSQFAMRALDAWREIGEQHCSKVGWNYLSGFNAEGARRRQLGTAHMAEFDEFPDTVMQALVRSEIYAVRPDTVDLVSAAAETIPYHPVLAGDELPSDVGFAFLGKSIGRLDIRGKMLRVHALQWWPTTVQLVGPDGPTARVAAVAYLLYSRWDDPDDEYSQDPRSLQIGRMGLHWPLSMNGVYGADQAAFAHLPAFMADLGEDAGRLTISEEAWPEAFFMRWLLSWWLLVKQEMLTISSVAVPRAARRRFERTTDRVMEVPGIKVVDLRRKERAARDAAVEAGSVDWTHRWGVRPHWRRQWYPSTQEHRMIFIGFQIRGPEDKPLILKPTVFDVRPPREE